MRHGLHQVQVPAGTPDGDIPIYDAATDELVMGPAPEPPVVGTNLDDVIVTVVNGVPLLMFDADSTPVTTEVP